MVKIRYAELPAGLHVVAKERDGCTVVYLLPGLTPQQRRAALTFARRSARIGQGPSLPAVDMAFAVAADRAWTTGRTVLAVLRKHPMLLLPLVAAVSAVIVVTMMSVVTVSLGPVKFPSTDGALPHRTGDPQGNLASHPSLDQAAASQPGGSVTQAPESTPTSFVRGAVVNSGVPAAGTAAPSIAGESGLPATGRLCIAAGRRIVCLRA
jgi:hypothetical protein